MKMVFFFMSSKHATSYNDDWEHQNCGEYYNKHHKTEGYFLMLQKLLDEKIITDLTVLFESRRAPGKANFVKGAKNYVIPNIECSRKFIDSDTVIFVRGGFKHWHDFLLEYKGKNWLICYAANTGRDKWLFWDIIFDDLQMKNIIDKHERYHFPFVKPINEDIFKPLEYYNQKWDVCIGASNVHDKKGQWKAVELLETYAALFGRELKAVMPGAIRRGTHTNEMLKSEYVKNNVMITNTVSREELCGIMNSSKVFLHLGSGGQNDRGIIEAFCTGMPVGFSNKKRFTPLLIPDNNSVYLFDETDKIEQWAEKLRKMLKNLFTAIESTFEHKMRLNQIFSHRMGFDSVGFPLLSYLFSDFPENPDIVSKLEIQQRISGTKYWYRFVNLLNR